MTLDAIFEATIQLLLADGLPRLTTTRVAERAGVSVGTLYQYFPHKQALLYALNERYLDALADRIEATCLAHHGVSLRVMIDALIETYWKAKTERADVTRALYRTAVELDNEALIEDFAARVDAATLAMLASASDWTGQDLAGINLTLVTVIFGTVRNAFERNLPPAAIETLRDHLLRMCHAYLSSAGKRHGPADVGG
nr:TetR/AcrR family transcriptional regulator [Azospirillum picis]